ncbi:hypothetical protein JZ751_025090 [Albula glossodonta]|uniref:Uncharacterized protein n=1 Tax=Albula glossodonta TaxID=121402 RepID=A0A8T2PGB5_9TELE|nr:hypothetical protein JZ751_025090 [Albula glossodonta]
MRERKRCIEDAPHTDDDHGVQCDEQQVDAEEQEVHDVSHVAPLVLLLALLLHGDETGDVPQDQHPYPSWHLTVLHGVVVEDVEGDDVPFINPELQDPRVALNDHQLPLPTGLQIPLRVPRDLLKR